MWYKWKKNEKKKEKKHLPSVSPIIASSDSLDFLNWFLKFNQAHNFCEKSSSKH